MKTIKMMNVVGGALLAVALVACGSKSKSDTTTAEQPAATDGVALKLAEVTVYDGKEPLFKLHADGTTELGTKEATEVKWVAGPTFKADGTLLVDGEPKAKLTQAGIAITGTDKVLPLAIKEDSVSVSDADKQISFSLEADGSLKVAGLDTKGKSFRFEGASPEALHTGLVVWSALFVLTQQVEQPAPAAEATPAAPAAEAAPAPAPAPEATPAPAPETPAAAPSKADKKGKKKGAKK